LGVFTFGSRPVPHGDFGLTYCNDDAAIAIGGVPFVKVVGSTAIFVFLFSFIYFGQSEANGFTTSQKFLGPSISMSWF
jgi:hypothetical protein